MKVGLFPGTLKGGGAERVMLQLANSFADHAIDVTLYVLTKEGEYVGEVGEKVKLKDYEARFGAKSIIHKVRRTLKRDGLDVVICTLPYISFVVAIASLGLKQRPKLIYREASTPSQDAQADWRRKFFRYIVKRFDHVVAVSNAAKEDFVKTYNVSPGKVSVIYNPVVDEQAIKKSEATVDHPWVKDKKGILIVSVGRVVPSKRYDTLIEAVALLHQKLETVRLLILGERNENSACYKKLVAQINAAQLTGCIEFAGFDNNPYKYLSKASVFVLSSEYEGLPGVLIQALACGCQVVSTNCPSGPEEILAGGQYGRLVEIGNPQQMADAIIGAIEKPIDQNSLKERGSYFGVEKSVGQYADLLMRMVHGSVGK